MDIKSLTSIDKFHLLSKNTLPEHGKFTQNRRFKSSTVKSYGEKSKYIHYSETTDKIFCLPCGMFASNKKQLLPSKWINGYSDWKNISVKGKKGLPYHLNSECHLSCHFQAEKFLDSMLSKKNEIARMVDSAKMKRISENNELLDAVIKNVRFCGVQGIGLRGHSEKFDTENPHKNRGNFLALMDLTGSYSDNLEKMLLSVKKQTQDGTRPQASMMSSSIQNELIDVFGNLVLKSILDDEKKQACMCSSLTKSQCLINNFFHYALDLFLWILEKLKKNSSASSKWQMELLSQSFNTCWMSLRQVDYL